MLVDSHKICADTELLKSNFH